MEKKLKPSVKITVETKELDEALEKASRLVTLLREAQEIIDSLAEKKLQA